MDQRNENRGRDQNIINQPGTVVINPSHQPERSRTEQQLLQFVKQEVESRLRQSLHNAVLINLGKAAQPEQVKRPWDAEVKIGARPAEPIPETTSILDVFDRSDLGGKLLILGNPGAGKTTTLLDLAKALIGRAEADVDFPIPVLFNLSAWKEDKQHIRDWLIVELKQKYGVRAELGEQWLKERRLLPLLDGLDEVKPERQEPCVQAINAFLTGEDAPLYAVVCSRREEYNTYETRLQLNGAICLQALTLPQIQQYLADVNRPELWDLLNQDAALLELVQAPLFLSVIILAYPQDSLDDWQQLNSREERLQDLWDRYICRMFEREIRNNPYSRKTPSQKQARHWLVWLAKQMQRESQTEFLIERMQPSWLVGRDHGLYQLIGGLIGGLIFGLIFGLTSVGLNVGLFGGLFGGLIYVLSIGLIFVMDNIFPVEAIHLSFTHKLFREILLSLRERLIFGLIFFGLIAGLIFGLIYGVFYGLISGLVYGAIVYGVIYGLLGGLSVGLIYGLSVGLVSALKADIEIRLQPNQGIKNSIKNTVIISGLGLLSAAILYVLLSSTLNPILDAQDVSSIIVTSVSLLIWMSFFTGGGLACIQHFSLRWVLFRSGVAPWNYARFLDYASERLLIQRVGGRYRFIHKLLQDHFAAMPLD